MSKSMDKRVLTQIRADVDPVLRAAWEMFWNMRTPDLDEDSKIYNTFFTTLVASTEAQRVKQEMGNDA